MTTEENIGIGPPGYHQRYYSDRNWTAYSDLLARVVRYSQPGPILDLGAGCGYFVEAAARWGFESVGLEGASEAVDMAKKRMPDLDIRQHRLSEIFPFDENYFATVLLNQVIEHLEPQVMRHALHEAHRVLRPGGMLLITSPSCYNKAELMADPTHINLLSPRDLKNELENCEFNKIVSFNSPLALFGKNWLGIRIMYVLFKILQIDALSGTANAIAYKN
jgi:SAM-dependent methyltransferase